MILDMKPIAMAEAKDIIENSKQDEKEVGAFIKRFSKIDIKEAGEMRKALEELDLMKLKEEYVIKVIDLLPTDASDLNKIFVDTSLDENEISKILEIVKKYG